MAKKYCGSAEETMGKVIYIDNNIKGTNLAVTGILKNIPSNSHLHFDILIPMDLYDRVNNPKGAWNNFDVYVYFQLKDEIKPSSLVISHIQKQVNTILKKNLAELDATLFAQPLTDIHLHSHYMLDVDGQGNSQHVKIFSLVAIFIILIACINFMNLSTA